MVKITEGLVRRKSEHHDGLLSQVEEITLHQESIEKIEFIQNWCPKLEILFLQSNLIAKIENLHKLKYLKYLNLALNNIEKIEHLEKCESLEKLDLTLNFIGDLQSVDNLKKNYNLKELHLMGNPCADFQNYRDFVIATLPQLVNLDGNKIRHSDRINASHVYDSIIKSIQKDEDLYRIKRNEQKLRLEREINERAKIFNDEFYDEEQLKKFWNEKTEHAPEIRYEMERMTQLKKRHDGTTVENKKKDRPLFAEDGKPYNINQPKLDFFLDDADPREYTLDLAIYKYLDTDLLKVDIQPNYIRVVVKGKIFQLALRQEIDTDKSTAKRSQITGHLIIKMPIMNCNSNYTITSEKVNIPKSEKCENEPVLRCQGRRELLEIGSSVQKVDYTKICSDIHNPKCEAKKPVLKLKAPSATFIDKSDVPPLM